MRESLLSIAAIGLSRLELAPTDAKQSVRATQSRSGVLPGFCTDRGGTPYVVTSTSLTLSTGAGEAVSIDDVLVTDQTASSFEVPLSKKTASELSRNSVPRLSAL